MKNQHICTVHWLKHWLCTVSLVFFVSIVHAQTYVTGTLSSTTLAAGQYTNNTAIHLGVGFGANGANGAYHFYIETHCCVPLNTSLSQSQNYISTFTPRQTGITDVSGLASKSTCEVRQIVQYFDGLGRPIQTVQVKGSSGLNDVIQPQAYDPSGQETKKYLPYTDPSGSSGSYRANALADGSGNYSGSDQRAFYQNATSSSGIVNIGSGQVPYAETRLEASPLNRPLEQGAPGLNWQIGGGHTVSNTYDTNTSTDAIRYWVVSSSGGASYSTTYAANTLYKTTVTDENGNATVEFKDFTGKVICREVQSGSSYLTTDYIYDIIGNLCYVIPPLPSASTGNPAINLPTSFAETDNVFNNFFYGYHYDGLNRLSSKKIPGKGWQYIVYDNLDQPILTQDALQATNGIWMFSKYDERGRVVMTGEYASTSSVTTLQSTSDSFTGTLWESYNNGNTNYGYTHNSYPDITSGTSNKILTVNYFDNYDVIGNSAVNPSSSVFATPQTAIDTLSQSPRGLITASLVNILGTSNYLFTVNHYDTYGRAVKIIVQNYVGGSVAYNKYDTEEDQYSFNGVITKSIRKHYLPTSASPQLTVITSYNYDQANRKTLLQQQYITPTNIGPTVTLAKYDYNELGQLMTKHLHSTASGTPVASSFLQHIDYRYNARGWLSRINNPSNLADENFSSQFDVFAEQLDYDVPNSGYGGTAKYNGNISTMSWQTKVPSTLTSVAQEVKGYAFTYDGLNRLTLAASKGASTGNGQYNEAISYDELGNILTLSRNNTASTFLNSLTYSYTNSSVRSNRLNAVADNGTVTESNNSSYTYDANGNTNSDSKKTVSSIAYNDLNLPALVTLSSKTINYWYDANGNKLEKVTKAGSTVLDDRSYDNSIEYSGNNIELVHTEEGRAIAPSSGNYILQYQVNDHLGNIRALFSDANNDGSLTADEILQVSDYYAFGREITPLSASTPDRYKYNGKELQDDLNQYDYGARFYDPVIGRWTTMDPLAEKSRRWSPYVYAENNPVRLIDPDGMETDDPELAYSNSKSTTTTQSDGNKKNVTVLTNTVTITGTPTAMVTNDGELVQNTSDNVYQYTTTSTVKIDGNGDMISASQTRTTTIYSPDGKEISNKTNSTVSAKYNKDGSMATKGDNPLENMSKDFKNVINTAAAFTRDNDISFTKYIQDRNTTSLDFAVKGVGVFLNGFVSFFTSAGYDKLKNMQSSALPSNVTAPEHKGIIFGKVVKTWHDQP